MDPPETDQPLTFSTVLRIDTRAGASEDLLALAKSRALDPAVFDDFPPFFFGGEISSNRWDAYETRMGTSTLKNYAEEADAGVAFLRNHNTGLDPTGHSLTGQFTGAQGNGISHLRADFYAITDPDSAAYLAKIRAGIVRDLSVGFFGGQWICSICGRDMQDWYSRDGCPHLLGMVYTPKDEAGTQSGDPQMARATIENAHLAEVSGVYNGATPGAMIDKARALADAGALDTRMRDLVQVRYRVQLPPEQRTFAVPPLPTPQEESTMPETTDQEARAVAAATEQALAPLTRALAAVAFPADIAPDLETRLRWLAGEHARLLPLADDGRAYRVDLVNQALTEGVRANGPEFAQDTYRAVLEAAPLAVITRMRDDWKALGDAAFAGGRLTQETDAPPAPRAPVDTTPDAAYRA